MTGLRRSAVLSNRLFILFAVLTASVVETRLPAAAASLSRPLSHQLELTPQQSEQARDRIVLAQMSVNYCEVSTRDGDGVNLRSGPSVNAQVIAKLPDGLRVRFNTGDRSGMWAEITTPNRRIGWVATSYLYCDY
jgi:uncharacterized protein YgiM (DUF1202 family)